MQRYRSIQKCENVSRSHKCTVFWSIELTAEHASSSFCRALPQVNRQARRLSGLPVDTLPEFRVDVAIEDDTAKQNRLKRQMASAFLSGLTRDRRLAIADRQRQTLAVANSGRTDDSMQLTSSAAHVAHRKGEAVDQDVQIWLEQKGRREAAAEQIGFLTVSQVFYGDSVLSLPPID
eukprot:SAG31_NODE_393_length_16293_cov_15.804372_12_plen_177_part_00